MIAIDESMVHKFLEVVEQWCKNNDFDVNLTKSGYFLISNERENANFNFTFCNKPFKKIEHLKYLGFLLSKNGSWTEYFEMLIKRAIGKLAQLYHFFRDESIDFETKINVARALILSSLTYGSDFIATNDTQIKALEVILRRTIRTVLRQPRHSKPEALHILTGLSSMNSVFTVNRVRNFVRISNLPNHSSRLIHNFLTGPEGNTRGTSADRFSKDLINLRKAQTYSDIDQITFFKTLGNVPESGPNAREIYKPDETNRVFRRITFEKDRIEQINRYKQATDFSFLKIFNSFRFHPIMKKAGSNFSTLISWMIGATSCYADKPRQDGHRDDPDGCRLCKSSIENREHLLTDCTGTIHLLSTAAEVTPVRSVDRTEIGTGKRGEITSQLQNAFFGLFKGETEDKWGWLDALENTQGAEKSA